jgi:hypothetical protein
MIYESKLTTTQTDKISQQPENCENRNDPDLVQAFLKKWWVESDFKAPNLPLSLRLVKMYIDKEIKKNVKDIFLSMCDVKIFLTFTSPNMVPYLLMGYNPHEHL